jgi:hypothetical protein
MAWQRSNRQPIDLVDAQESLSIYSHHAIGRGQQIHAAGGWPRGDHSRTTHCFAKPPRGLVLVHIARLQHGHTDDADAELAQERQVFPRQPVALGQRLAATFVGQVVAQDVADRFFG